MKKLIRFLIIILILAGIADKAVPEAISDFVSDSDSLFDSALDSVFDPAADSVSESDLNFPDHYCYYYNQLSEEEKQVYLEIYAALRDRLEEQKLSTTDTDLMTHVFSLVQLDHPELLWTDSCTYLVTSNFKDEIKSISLTPEYTMTEEDIQTAETGISDYRDGFFRYLSEQYGLNADDSDDWEKAFAAFEWVISNTEYVTDAPHNQDMYSAVLGQTVCQGYSTAFKYLCDRMDIPCLIVTGTAETGGAHAWDMVYLNGTWCHVDCTYGDDAVLDFAADYSWFGVSDDLIQKERSCTENDLLPEGDRGQNGYFYQKGFWQDTYDLKALKEIVDGDSAFGVTFASDDAYSEACRDLFENKNVQKLGDGSGFTYVMDELSRTIYVQVME